MDPCLHPSVTLAVHRCNYNPRPSVMYGQGAKLARCRPEALGDSRLARCHPGATLSWRCPAGGVTVRRSRQAMPPHRWGSSRSRVARGSCAGQRGNSDRACYRAACSRRSRRTRSAATTRAHYHARAALSHRLKSRPLALQDKRAVASLQGTHIAIGHGERGTLHQKLGNVYRRGEVQRGDGGGGGAEDTGTACRGWNR